MNVWQEHIHRLEASRFPGNEDQAMAVTSRRLRDIASRRLFGIDFNPILVRAAQMNLVMHGDGSTNVFHANSLLPFGEWPDEAGNEVRSNIKANSFRCDLD